MGYGRYILVNGEAVSEPDVLTWGAWMEDHNSERFIAKTTVEMWPIAQVYVSTVFLGLDHGFGDETLELFETMVFGGPMNEHCWRYATRAEAREGHDKAVAIVKEAEGDYGPREWSPRKGSCSCKRHGENHAGH